jgi:hypothetical protein
LFFSLLPAEGWLAAIIAIAVPAAACILYSIVSRASAKHDSPVYDITREMGSPTWNSTIIDNASDDAVNAGAARGQWLTLGHVWTILRSTQLRPALIPGTGVSKMPLLAQGTATRVRQLFVPKDTIYLLAPNRWSIAPRQDNFNERLPQRQSVAAKLIGCVCCIPRHAWPSIVRWQPAPWNHTTRCRRASDWYLEIVLLVKRLAAWHKRADAVVLWHVKRVGRV